MARSLAGAPAGTLAGMLAGVAAATIWSGWYVLARHGVTGGGMNAWDQAALRFLVAAPLLLVILRRFPFPLRKWPLALIMGLGVGPPFGVLVGTGFEHAPANFGGALAAVSGVVLTLAGGRIILHEPLSRLQKVGIAIAVAGLALLILAAGSVGHAWYFLAGGLLWAGYSIAYRRSGLTPFEGVATVAVLAALLYLPGYFWVAGGRLWQIAPAELALQAIGQGAFAGIVALVLHARAVAVLGAINGALFQSLVPPFTLILSFACLGEVPTPVEALAIGIILPGVWMALKYRA